MNKKFVVYGLGLSGKTAVEFLLNINQKVIISNDRLFEIDEIKKKYPDHPLLESMDYSEYDWSEIECIILSAGISFTHPEPHPVVMAAQKNNCPIVSDVEILTRFCPNGNYIGVTGTNGKSTITSLIGHIFKNSNLNSDYGGNLGNKATLSLKTENENGNYIIELSSYMTDITNNTKLNFAVLSNLTPDHIDRHGDFQGYVNAKKKVFKNQDENCYGILNIEDKETLNVFNDLESDLNYKGNLIKISSKKILSKGYSAMNGVFYKDGNKLAEFISFDNLPGEHNLENILCALAVCHLNGVSIENFISHTRSFVGLKHRMQNVGELNGVRFINDSKGTNAEASAQALNTYDNIHWIIGGISKEEGIVPLKNYFPKVKKAYLIGEASDKFAKTLSENNVKFELCYNLESATKKAYEEAVQNRGNIVLSPACSSFDQFKNFEERGDKFVSLFEEIKIIQ